jgi:hypothetical protein
MRIRIPGASLITIRRNPSEAGVCAITLPEKATLQQLSRFTGGAKDTGPFSQEFTHLADMVGQAFENSPLRNKDHKKRLEPYQKVGIAFGLVRKGRAGLFDPMGLGKTVQAIGLALTCPEKYLPLVIICPLNAIGAWRKQLGSVDTKAKATPAEIRAAEDKARLEDAWVKPKALDIRVIKTPEELRDAALNPPQGRNYALIIQKELLFRRDRASEEVDEAIDDEEASGRATQEDAALDQIAGNLSNHGLLIVDEGHYYKNPTGTAFRRLYRMASDAAHVLVLTGTPAMISVTDTLPIMALIDIKGDTIRELSRFGRSGTIAGSARQTRAARPTLSFEDESEPVEANRRVQANRIGGVREDVNLRQSRRPWVDLQNDWIERHGGGVGSSTSVPEAAGTTRDFDDYTRGAAQRVESEFRQLAARRDRRSVKDLEGAKYLGIQKKERQLILDREAGKYGMLDAGTESRFRFLERALLLREIDALALRTALGLKPEYAGMSDDQIADAVLRDPSRAPWFRQFEQQTRTLKSAVGSAQKIPIGESVVRRAAGRYEEAKLNGNYVPIVYFTYHTEVEKQLLKELWDRYRGKARIFNYGTGEGEVTDVTQERTAKGKPVIKISTKSVKERGDPRGALEVIAAEYFAPKQYTEPHILVMTSKGKEGVDLPGGVEVVFVERFVAPGHEEQAEDRINRANRDLNAPPPSIRYYMPDHFTAYALLNRLERRRASAQRTYGEDAESDYSHNLELTCDPNLSVADDYLCRSFMAEADFAPYIKSRLKWARTVPVRPATPNPRRRRNPDYSATYAQDLIAHLENEDAVRAELVIPRRRGGRGDTPPPPSVACTSTYTEAQIRGMIARAEAAGINALSVVGILRPTSPPCRPVTQRVYFPRLSAGECDDGPSTILHGYADESRKVRVAACVDDISSVKFLSPFVNEEAQARGMATIEEAYRMWTSEKEPYDGVSRYMPKRRLGTVQSTATAYGYITFVVSVDTPDGGEALVRVYGRPFPNGGKDFRLREGEPLMLDRAETRPLDEGAGAATYVRVAPIDPLRIMSDIEHVPPHPAMNKKIEYNGRKNETRHVFQGTGVERGARLTFVDDADVERTITLTSGSTDTFFGHPPRPLMWARVPGELHPAVSSGYVNVYVDGVSTKIPLKDITKYETPDRVAAERFSSARPTPAPASPRAPGPFQAPQSTPATPPPAPEPTGPSRSEVLRATFEKAMDDILDVAVTYRDPYDRSIKSGRYGVMRLGPVRGYSGVTLRNTSVDRLETIQLRDITDATLIPRPPSPPSPRPAVQRPSVPAPASGPGSSRRAPTAVPSREAAPAAPPPSIRRPQGQVEPGLWTSWPRGAGQVPRGAMVEIATRFDGKVTGTVVEWSPFPTPTYKIETRRGVQVIPETSIVPAQSKYKR